MDQKQRELSAALADLEKVMSGRKGRGRHQLPDLAVNMFASQVLQYGRAVELLAANNLSSWASPSARAAFEAGTDLLFLLSAPSLDVFDQLGALAMVNAEMVVSKSHGKARLASEKLRADPAKKPEPLKQRIKKLADYWGEFRPDAPSIVWDAFDKCKAAWKEGRKNWTTFGREAVHKELRDRLQDPPFSTTLDSWYDILSSRSHSGAHTPEFEWRDGRLGLLLEEDDPLPATSALWSAKSAIMALSTQWPATT